jgi:broad specificity phosphatase PhoE
MIDFSGTQQRHIVLLRHAQPSYDIAQVMRRGELAAAIADYDAGGINLDCIQGAQALANTDAVSGRAVTLVSSDLPRATESARAFFPSLDLSAADPLYREAGLPSNVPMPFCWLELRFSSLTAAMRLLWVLGLPSDAETYGEARVRAALAAQKLDELAHRSDCVILVGHGFQNHLIARALKKNGWHIRSKHGNSYGASAIFSIGGDAA